MGKIEWCILDSREKEHEVIVNAVSEFNRMGYLISGVCFKNGALEIVCYPPARKDGSEKELRESLEEGHGKDNAGLSMDGVSETFKG